MSQSKLRCFFTFADAVIGFIQTTDTVGEDSSSIETCIQIQNKNVMLQQNIVVVFSTADRGGVMSATSKNDNVSHTCI